MVTTAGGLQVQVNTFAKLTDGPGGQPLTVSRPADALGADASEVWNCATARGELIALGDG